MNYILLHLKPKKDKKPILCVLTFWVSAFILQHLPWIWVCPWTPTLLTTTISPELYLHVFSKLCQINRVRSSFDAKTLEMLIKSLVFSKMIYCSTVWANTSSSNIKKTPASPKLWLQNRYQLKEVRPRGSTSPSTKLAAFKRITSL